MALNLIELDDVTRKLMLEEFESDKSSHNLFISTRLNERGRLGYPDLLRQAFEQHDSEWLANQLSSQGFFNPTESRAKPSGGFTEARVPSNADQVLSEGEFNRFYIRAICRRAIDNGINEVEVYRAKTVSNARPQSEGKIGQLFSAHTVLDDLRANTGIDTALGLPNGPNSGLSVCLPK